MEQTLQALGDRHPAVAQHQRIPLRPVRLGPIGGSAGRVPAALDSPVSAAGAPPTAARRSSPSDSRQNVGGEHVN